MGFKRRSAPSAATPLPSTETAASRRAPAARSSALSASGPAPFATPPPTPNSRTTTRAVVGTRHTPTTGSSAKDRDEDPLCSDCSRVGGLLDADHRYLHPS